MFHLQRNITRCALVLGLAATPSPMGAQTRVADLQIAPSQVELQLGERKTVLVTAYDGTGNVIPGARFDWSVEESVLRVHHDPSSPNILYVDGVGYGVTAITVRAGRVTADARVRVANAPEGSGSGPATHLRLDPPLIHLLPTEERHVAPLFLRSDGSPAASQHLEWRSLLPTVATVDDRGSVVGISTGQGVIEATTRAGLTARAIVVVANTTIGFARRSLALARGGSDTVRVLVPAHDNRLIGNEQFMWTSTAPRLVMVSQLGVITGLAEGQAEVLVTGFGQQHRLPVMVHEPVESIVTDPRAGSIALPLGDTIAFNIRMLNANGGEVKGIPLQWRVSDPAVVHLDPRNSRAMGRAVGTATVTVRGPRDDLSAEWTVEVIPGN